MLSRFVGFGVVLAVLVSFGALKPGCVYAANSGALDISGRVNSSLVVTVTSNGAQSFDPSATNTSVKVGELTITANASGINNYVITAYKASLGGGPDQGNSGLMTLANGSVTQNYTLRLVPQTSAPALTGGMASPVTSYGQASASQLSVSGNIVGAKYDIRISTTQKVLTNGTYSDRIVFTFVAI
jgi:hypothetical protein